MFQSWTADELYGAAPGARPNAVPAPTHAGHPEPFAQLHAFTGVGLLNNPVFFLVALLGIAMLIVHVSVHGSLAVGVSA